MGTVDVSIVVPTSHREQFLGEAIESALRQRDVSVEVIVVGDGAQAGARAIVERVADPRLSYLDRAATSQGRSGAVRNEGVPRATGRYLHFLDDDDRLEDGALARLERALDGNPRAAAAFGRIVPFGGTADELAHERAYWEEAARAARRVRTRVGLAARMLFRDALLACSACMVRREAFAAVGGFDDSLDACVDGDLYLRVIRRFGFVFVDGPVVQRRIGHLAVTRSGESRERYRRAYRRIHEKYRLERGAAEFYALKTAVRLSDLVSTSGRARRAL